MLAFTSMQVSAVLWNKDYGVQLQHTMSLAVIQLMRVSSGLCDTLPNVQPVRVALDCKRLSATALGTANHVDKMPAFHGYLYC